MTPVEIARMLADAGARDEALGEYVPARRRFGVPLKSRIIPVGRAWRLVDTLLSAEGDIYAVGSVVRAITPKDFNSDKTLAGEARRELQRAAIRGGVAENDTVNIGWTPAPAPVGGMLAERAMLLIEQTRMR